MENEGIRLNKYLSEAGICSRRQADVLIESGKVLINGEKPVVGTKVMLGDKVTVNGKRTLNSEKLILLAFNKPKGIECTSDKNTKDNIIDYINYPKRIYTIGRLDKDSTGLILLTNDGNLSNEIQKARNYHEKEYIVMVNKDIKKSFIDSMRAGVDIGEAITRECYVEQLSKNSFKIILTQGLNRQIRKMCEVLGYKVTSLKRVRVMNINLGNLKEGKYRNVTESEIKSLKILIDKSK